MEHVGDELRPRYFANLQEVWFGRLEIQVSGPIYLIKTRPSRTASVELGIGHPPWFSYRDKMDSGEFSSGTHTERIEDQAYEINPSC
jgi:hypothetical protein